MPRASWRRAKEMAPATMARRLTELVDGLGLETTAPHLLNKIEELNRRLPMSRQALLAAVARSPGLLAYTPESVGGRVALLVQELRRDEAFVMEMIAKQPQVLGLKPETLRHRIGTLHEAASLMAKWRTELDAMRPASLARLLRCSDAVLSRLLYSYARSHSNGRNFESIRSMAYICCCPRAAWHRDNPLHADWLAAGEAARRDWRITPWLGWYQQPPRPGVPPAPGQYNWWSRGDPGPDEYDYDYS
ncbi:hypothetical protein GPECTOR_91g569 [Gonium pectorale]|uniref:Uncharacterized protein n=1 Tax=Gonium pectorale TaxID=33097 RepID=A0A150G1P8_GONPE|nr:hypothetical protein GPECTOR_91g569 [Gonium pectorale]|eukprot:KXZ43415.1 hypothetical protein GPECTOR_91g569 [Gonium pectorale]